LRQRYAGSAVSPDRKLVSLSLGVHYLETSPRLALQYLTSAELACADDSPLLPIVRYYEAEARLADGGFAEAALIAEGLLADNLGPGWERLVYGVLIESYFGSGQYAKLTKSFQDYSKHYSFSRRQEALARMAALATEKQGDTSHAGELLEELARGYPTTDESRWAFRRLLDLSCDQGAKRPRYVFSQRLLLQLSRNVIIDQGLKAFLIAAADQPMQLDDGTVHRLTTEEKADYFFQARFYRESLTLVSGLLDDEKARATPSPSRPNLEFELGRIHMRLYEPMAAMRYFSDFLYDYPKHPLALRALESLADALKYSGAHRAAAESYAAAADQSHSAGLRWAQFWELLRGKDYQAALTLLETPGYVVPRAGDSPATISYWHGRLLAWLGRKDEAARQFSDVLLQAGDSFYANMVAVLHPELLGKGSAALVKNGSAEAASQGAMAARLLGQGGTASTVSSSDLKLVEALLGVGLRDAAATQLTSLEPGTFARQDSFAAAMRVALSLNDYQPTRRLRFLSFSPLYNLPDDWDGLAEHQVAHKAEWRLYYPLAFPRIVAKIASRIRINPLLILSVMRAESFYNKEARSGVGAQGLMQLMPYTALKIAALIGDEAFDVRDLSTPATNISYGAYYLDRLLRYYGGNPFLAVAAYNGGPAAVNQWYDSCRNCTADEFVGSIPYRETRRYVREVMKNYMQYARLYTGKEPFRTLPPMPKELPEGEEIF